MLLSWQLFFFQGTLGGSRNTYSWIKDFVSRDGTISDFSVGFCVNEEKGYQAPQLLEEARSPIISYQYLLLWTDLPNTTVSQSVDVLYCYS